MRLEVDFGNTFVKWRIVDGEAVVQRGREYLEKLDLPVTIYFRGLGWICCQF